MNANELADEFQNRQNWKLINYIHWSEQSETMLRQQHFEVSRLKVVANDFIDEIKAKDNEIIQQQAEIKRLEEQLSIAYEENDNYWIEKGKEK